MERYEVFVAQTILLLTRTKVVGDLWERYLKLIDEGIPDGYGYASLGGLCVYRILMNIAEMLWISLGANAIAVVE